MMHNTAIHPGKTDTSPEAGFYATQPDKLDNLFIRLGDDTPAFCWGGDFRRWEYGIGLDISRNNLVSYGILNHEGAGRCGLDLEQTENFHTMYFVPSPSDWDAETINHPRSVIRSGIL